MWPTCWLMKLRESATTGNGIWAFLESFGVADQLPDWREMASEMSLLQQECSQSPLEPKTKQRVPVSVENEEVPVKVLISSGEGSLNKTLIAVGL